MVVQRVLGGEAVGELIEAAVLEEAPHRPDELLVRATELETVTAELPVERIATLNYGVPGMHGSGAEVVADGRIALQREVGSAPGCGAAEPGALDAEFAYDVVLVGAFSGVHHDQPRDGS